MQSLNLKFARLALISVVLTVSACRSQHPTYAPDGRRAYVVTCGGFLNSYGSCLIKAGRACGNRGYDVLKGGEDDRELLVACKIPGSK